MRLLAGRFETRQEFDFTRDIFERRVLRKPGEQPEHKLFVAHENIMSGALEMASLSGQLDILI